MLTTTILDALTTAAAWPWLPIITTLARVGTALIGLTIAVHRGIRYWRHGRHR